MLRDSPPHPAEGFETLEAAVLPTVSGMLDAMLEAASLARAGCDADRHADALRMLAGQLEAVTGEIEAIAALASLPNYASAA